MHFTMNLTPLFDYVWQTYLAKMFKADGVKLHLQVLTSEDLSYQVCPLTHGHIRSHSTRKKGQLQCRSFAAHFSLASSSVVST